MIRKFLIAGLSLFNTINLPAQDPRDILQKSYNKCQTIQNGYYEMTSYFKFMDFRDTSKSVSKCHFKKLENDGLDLPAFRYESGNIAVYTGNDLIVAQPSDSTATIMSKAMWPTNIQNQLLSYRFYSPLINKKYPTLQHDSDFTDKRYIFIFIGEEQLGNDVCYHIQVNDTAKDLRPGMMTIGVEYHYWIKKSEFIPIQYSIALDNVTDNDTTNQYEKNVLNNYKINYIVEDTFPLNSLPNYYKLKDYVPFEGPPLLSKGTVAPDWELLSLRDEKTKLKDFKGQLLLIDFFSKPCYPCMLALPGLQALHEKYIKKGLKVVGIDIYDKKEDGIVAFLSKRGVSYTVLLAGKDVGEDYHVSGIPTIYLIDKDGKIIFSHVGYVKGQEETLEEVIKKNL